MDSHSTLQKKPIDYIKIIFRRKWLLVIPIILGMVGGIFFGNSLPKIFRSSTLILIEEGRIINPLIEGLAVSSSTAQRLALLRQKILGWDRMSQLIKKLDLAKDVKTQEGFEKLVKRLRKKIDVALPEENSIVRISYEDEDNVQAKDVVEKITDIFISENLKEQNRETEVAIKFINDQLVLYQKKLKQSEIASMQDELDALLVDSTERHPLVIELKNKINAAEEEVERGDFALNKKYEENKDTPSLSLEELKAELLNAQQESIVSGIDVTKTGANRTKVSTASNEQLYKLLLMDKVDQVNARDAGVNQKLYNKLLERLETAKITQSLEASKEGTRYTILDPARVASKPIKPNKLQLLLVGMFLGACVGGGLVFSAEMFDHSFLGVDEAKAFFDIPIFGAIPKIITQDDVNANKQKNAIVVTLSILIGIALFMLIIFKVLM